MVGVTGLEPARCVPLDPKSSASASFATRPIKKCIRFEKQVHYLIKWCRLSESNQQPTDYKSVALPIELRRHAWWTLQGSNLRPLPCEGNALPTELSVLVSLNAYLS